MILAFREASMMKSRTVLIAVAALSAMAALHPASAQEKLVATYGEARTILAFKVSDAALQKILPAGWASSPIGAGPSKDANLTVSFIDCLTVQGPDGKPEGTLQLAAVAAPVKKTGTDATVAMVITGFASVPSFVPGPYGTFALGKVTMDRSLHTDPAGISRAEESWEFRGDGGAVIQLQLQFVRGVAARGKVEAKIYSSVRPDFYRIYRIEQAVDVVRSVPAGTDQVQKYVFKASGPQFAPLFDGSEQLISVTSLPWYSRQVFLPPPGM
jgi:hypothetical protein